jgi:23S rRNA pseudouridine1911/1915/1917 synthase
VCEEAVRTFRPDRGDAGHRLDHVLLRQLNDRRDASRTQIQRWIRGGRVSVGGRVITRVAARVPAGAMVAVSLAPEPARPPHAGEAIPLSILYEDAHLLAVDKPSGMVAHPSFGHARGTLVNALLWLARDWPAGSRPGLVHRLDRHTSGVVLVSKTSTSHARLARALADRRVEKDYLAVVAGRVTRARGDIVLGVMRDPGDRRRMVASPVSGRPSVTRYVRIARSVGRRAGVSVLRCRLVTGRMHQIRVHLATAGWPIVGDAVYGPPSDWRIEDAAMQEAVRRFARQALHAWRVAFTHPVTGARVEIVAPLPDDIRHLLDVCGIELQRDRAVAGMVSR